MNKSSIFDMYHPIIAALFFVAALLFSMFAFQPVFVVISFIAALLYNAFLQGWRKAFGRLGFQIPLILVISCANGLLAQSGSTELFRIGYHAFYLESFVYGAFMGAMLMTVFQWFSAASVVLSSDKIMMLTGSTIPTLGLMLTMISRLIPQFVRRGMQIKQTQDACSAARSNAQAKVSTTEQRENVQIENTEANQVKHAKSDSKCGIESDIKSDNKGDIKNDDKNVNKNKKSISAQMKSNVVQQAARTTTVLMAWGMEDSLDTARAMQARGWSSTRTRSCYKRSNMKRGDYILLFVLVGLLALSIPCAMAALSEFAFYPTVSVLTFWWGYIPYVFFLICPLVLQIREDLLWKRL